ncbi:hypothetical protein BK816_03555 [Boudabousia tangfeifanii]|uniref:SGNH hydrolase-type esterase domain-containing protein n=1 Tax=Boudabousia tangfeifanii TaxID=1912795 RepID=A0A1D9MJX2_9ACTO|nr:GDSL-type esterase/lipase family protein [Boudabousia tangfeifanii]AOZ72483.1 hypothetical protein BK816_03555 [Boudabousia tangfeifanii]
MTKLVFLGDELVAGTGDERALGWIGRAVTRTEFTSQTDVLVLGIPQETTQDLSQRFLEEVQRRRPDQSEPLYVAVGMGIHDIEAGISSARTRLHLANTLDGLTKLGAKVMLVSPPPLPSISSNDLEELVQIGYEVAHRRQITWVDLYHPLVEHEQWRSDFLDPQAALPKQTGYGLMAWLVLHDGWYEWLSN